MTHIYITPEEYASAAANGIKRRTVDYRIRRAGWDREKAITQPVRRRNPYFKMALVNGITKSTFYRRLWLGWEPKRAAMTPPRERR